jgi:hypothetical protein
MENEETFLKRHADTIILLGVLFGVWWNMSNRFIDLDKRLTRIETVMVMQKFMPTELARREKIVDCEHGMD